jgi:hypothetical protein
MEKKMAQDIMVMYRDLAKRRTVQDDHSLLNELVERASAISASSGPLNKEQAEAFMECLCAAKMRLYDEGEKEHLRLSPLVHRFKLPLAVSNEAVRFVLDKPHDPDLNSVVACAAAVVACKIQPVAPHAGKESPSSPPVQACKASLV